MADLLRAKWLLAVLVVAGVLIWLGAARALTPTTLTVLTGAEGSTSHADALRYQTLLEQRGVRTTVEPTNGSVENLQRLVREGGNQIAFAEVGLERAVDDPEISEKLVSLGSVSVQPLWLFARTEMEVGSEADLEGRRVVLGAAGSGTRVFARAILEANGIVDSVTTVTLDSDDPSESVEALAAGALDGLFAVGEPDAPGIRTALDDERVQPLPFRRALAYERRYPGLIAVTIPEGALDLARNVPEEDMQLIALATNLVAPEGLHPSLIDVLLDVAPGSTPAPTCSRPPTPSRAPRRSRSPWLRRRSATTGRVPRPFRNTCRSGWRACSTAPFSCSLPSPGFSWSWCRRSHRCSR
jgi:TRAP transporter TAXI family solute receptor